MERIVYEQIQSYFMNNDLITTFQHAYRGKHSTATALTQMVDDWFEDMEERKIIGIVMLDFTAAFDIIDHDLLLKKWNIMAFHKWMRSYLSDKR